MSPTQLYQQAKIRKPFITTWNTATVTVGSSPANTVKFPTKSTGLYNCKVNWGDGNTSTQITTYNDAQWTHTYASAGTYTITVTGMFVGLALSSSGSNLDRNKITSVLQWGGFRPGTPNSFIFQSCQNLDVKDAVDIPNLYLSNDLSYFFGGGNFNMLGLTKVNNLEKWIFVPSTDLTTFLRVCLNWIQDINDLDVSNVIILNNTFYGCSKFVSPLDKWGTKVSNVVDMNGTFSGCSLFNQSLNNWNISKVISFIGCFQDAVVYNQPMNNWLINTTPGAGVTLAQMFDNANAFDQDISMWNTSEVISMGSMFNGANIFNKNINVWNTSKVTTMATMFADTLEYNQPLTTYTDGGGIHWDMNKVTTISGMFNGAKKFNQNLNSWDTSNITTMNGAFSNTDVYTNLGVILSWNTAKVANFGAMFNGAKVWNHPMVTSGTTWDMSKATTFTNMFAGALIFNKSLNSWNTILGQSFAAMFSGATAFNNGLPAGQGDTQLTFNTVAATSFGSMFLNASSFNCIIGQWNTASVTTIVNMFSGASKFNQSINTSGSLWNLSLCTSMNAVFQGATLFNNGLGVGVSTGVLNWTPGVLTGLGMESTFNNASSFNCTVNGFNTVNCIDFTSTFNGATVFNQSLATSGNFWNVAKVRYFNSTFANTSAFNQNLNTWNLLVADDLNSMFSNATAFNNGGVSGVLNWTNCKPLTCASTFANATAFNCDISSWDMSRCTTVANMFSGATAFDQNIGNWDLSACTAFGNFMAGKTAATFSAANLDAIYNGWTNKRLQDTKSISFGSAKYTIAVSLKSRNLLTNTNSEQTVNTISAGTGGVIKIPTGSTSVISNGVFVLINNMGIIPNGKYTVQNIITSTSYELAGTTYGTGAGFTPGGTVKFGYGWTITDGGGI